MNWIRYLIFGLIVSVCATAAFFAKDVVNWLNEAASFLTASIVIPANIFNMIIGLLVMIGGLVLFWERKTARFDWRTFGKAVFAFGAFVVLYNFLEAAQAFIVWASLALAFAAFLSFTESKQLRQQTVQTRNEEKESASARRRLEDVHSWINEALRLRAAFSVPVEGFEHMALASEDWKTQREVDRRRFVVNGAGIVGEAERLDNALPKESAIKAVIERLVLIFENESALSTPAIQREIDEKCITVIKVIGELRAILKL